MPEVVSSGVQPVTPEARSMPQDVDQIRSILAHNTGFDEPARWVGYAQSHGCRPVTARPAPVCPDCFGAPRPRTWGQYVYFSTLIHLLECGRCGLVWANAHIDPAIIKEHFERTYKDDNYFKVARRPIFEHLAGVIDAAAPPGAGILDIGGARGDLMATALGRRPDLKVTVQDLSKVATDFAATAHGFQTLTGDADTLASHRGQYDVVVLSDVLYYEPRLTVLWSALSRLVRPGGTIVIRVPNKAPLVQLGQLWRRIIHGRAGQDAQDSVSFYNPEHIFLFRRGYLRRRLNSVGFDRVRFIPSPVLSSGTALGAPMFALAKILNRVTLQGAVVSPAMIVVASRRESPEGGRELAPMRNAE
jgi:2-polyprenyl-3-methyl-5-hydroxy-6-metoxy-1,4-benzoquinol methylase